MFITKIASQEEKSVRYAIISIHLLLIILGLGGTAAFFAGCTGYAPPAEPINITASPTPTSVQTSTIQPKTWTIETNPLHQYLTWDEMSNKISGDLPDEEKSGYYGFFFHVNPSKYTELRSKMEAIFGKEEYGAILEGFASLIYERTGEMKDTAEWLYVPASNPGEDAIVKSNDPYGLLAYYLIEQDEGSDIIWYGISSSERNKTSVRQIFTDAGIVIPEELEPLYTALKQHGGMYLYELDDIPRAEEIMRREAPKYGGGYLYVLAVDAGAVYTHGSGFIPSYDPDRNLPFAGCGAERLLIGASEPPQSSGGKIDHVTPEQVISAVIKDKPMLDKHLLSN